MAESGGTMKVGIAPDGRVHMIATDKTDQVDLLFAPEEALLVARLLRQKAEEAMRDKARRRGVVTETKEMSNEKKTELEEITGRLARLAEKETIEAGYREGLRELVARSYSIPEIHELAEKHVTRYLRRVQAGKAGNRNIDVEACQKYLRLWLSIRRKAIGFLWLNEGKFYADLTDEERAEIVEAKESGE